MLDADGHAHRGQGAGGEARRVARSRPPTAPPMRRRRLSRVREWRRALRVAPSASRPRTDRRRRCAAESASETGMIRVALIVGITMLAACGPVAGRALSGTAATPTETPGIVASPTPSPSPASFPPASVRILVNGVETPYGDGFSVGGS